MLEQVYGKQTKVHTGIHTHKHTHASYCLDEQFSRQSTCFAVLSGIPRHTVTMKRLHGVHTHAFVHARVAGAFVNLCNVN